jgi:DNA-binding CsgD family transcriptional regulator
MQPHARIAPKHGCDGNNRRRPSRTAAEIDVPNRFATTGAINNFLADALYRLGRGLFIVTSTGDVLFANGIAEALLGGVLHLRQNRLATRDRAQSEALHHLIMDAGQYGKSGGVIVTQNDNALLLLTVTPVSVDAWHKGDGRPAAMIVTKNLNHTSRRLDAIGRHYCLTPAETLVAAELLVGDGIPGVARRLNISEATARTHRIRIFQKTGVGRQAQLVRLILEWSECAVNDCTSSRDIGAGGVTGNRP